MTADIITPNTKDADAVIPNVIIFCVLIAVEYIIIVMQITAYDRKKKNNNQSCRVLIPLFLKNPILFLPAERSINSRSYVSAVFLIFVSFVFSELRFACNTELCCVKLEDTLKLASYWLKRFVAVVSNILFVVV